MHDRAEVGAHGPATQAEGKNLLVVESDKKAASDPSKQTTGPVGSETPSLENGINKGQDADSSVGKGQGYSDERRDQAAEPTELREGADVDEKENENPTCENSRYTTAPLDAVAPKGTEAHSNTISGKEVLSKSCGSDRDRRGEEERALHDIDLVDPVVSPTTILDQRSSRGIRTDPNVRAPEGTNASADVQNGGICEIRTPASTLRISEGKNRRRIDQFCQTPWSGHGDVKAEPSQPPSKLIGLKKGKDHRRSDKSSQTPWCDRPDGKAEPAQPLSELIGPKRGEERRRSDESCQTSWSDRADGRAVPAQPLSKLICLENTEDISDTSVTPTSRPSQTASSPTRREESCQTMWDCEADRRTVGGGTSSKEMTFGGSLGTKGNVPRPASALNGGHYEAVLDFGRLQSPDNRQGRDDKYCQTPWNDRVQNQPNLGHDGMITRQCSHRHVAQTTLS